MTQAIPGALLIDPNVIQGPYPFYRQLQEQAPVLQVPGTDVFIVSSFSLLVEATGRVEDFSSSMHCFLYQDENGLVNRWSFSGEGVQMLTTADSPINTLHKRTVFPDLVAKRMALLEPEIVDVVTECMNRALLNRNVDY